MNMNERQHRLTRIKNGYSELEKREIVKTKARAKNKLLLVCVLACALACSSSVLLVKSIVDDFKQDMKHVEILASDMHFVVSKFKFDFEN